MPDTSSNPNAPEMARTLVNGSHRFAWLAWLGWVIAAAAVGAAIYFILNSRSLERQLNADQSRIAELSAENARSHDLVDALTSPDSIRVMLTETRRPPLPSGHVTYQPKSGVLAFVASNLRPLPASKTYELWLIPSSGKAPMPAGLFRPGAHGSTSVVLPSLPPNIPAKAFVVTVEEEQGATTPTLPIVMSGR